MTFVSKPNLLPVVRVSEFAGNTESVETYEGLFLKSMDLFDYSRKKRVNSGRKRPLVEGGV